MGQISRQYWVVRAVKHRLKMPAYTLSVRGLRGVLMPRYRLHARRAEVGLLIQTGVALEGKGARVRLTKRRQAW